MVEADPDNPDSGDVTVKSSCVDKLFSTFSNDPQSIENCMQDTFLTAGDMTSGNTRIADDAKTIEKFKEEKFRNPSLFIDGDPYHEPIYPNVHFSEEQMIADVCAALL